MIMTLSGHDGSSNSQFRRHYYPHSKLLNTLGWIQWQISQKELTEWNFPLPQVARLLS